MEWSGSLEEQRTGNQLTDRERDVLELMAVGLTNKGIAKRLELGARTVESHVGHVLGKLDATTRTGAVAEARQRGLLATDSSIGAAHSFEPARHNVPVHSAPLLGREEDVACVTRLLERDRLVTLR